MKSLEEEKEELITQYLATTSRPPAEAQKEQARIAVLLDGLYWKLVEQILQRSIDTTNNSLNFSEDDRLLLDFGFLDERLVQGAPQNLRQKLLQETQLIGAPNHFYLSEWLGDRFKRYQIDAEVNEHDSDAENSAGNDNAYRVVLSYLSRQNNGAGVKLPGVSETAMAAMFSGRLDSQIISMGVNLLHNRKRRDFLNRSRLAALRRDIITRARSTVTDRNQLKLFDALDEAYRHEWEQAYWAADPHATNAGDQTDGNAPDNHAAQDQAAEKAFHWLLSELRFVRTLLPLGALAGGILRPCAVMLENRPRVTRIHTARILSRVCWCDRNYQVAPVVLIAPFTGRGIYEWDRDSLVVSLMPVDNPEDSAANAVANFSMLVDSLQHNAILKNTYRAMFPKTNFQKCFQADYRTWLCAVGYGKFDALPTEKLEFFASQVAPDFATSPALALAPRELRTLSFTARDLIRKQMQRQVSTAKDSWMTRWRLGILYWLDNFTAEALRELTNAANLAPKELQTYFAVACLLAQTGRADKAKQLFDICRLRGKNSIWNFHAARAAEKML